MRCLLGGCEVTKAASHSMGTFQLRKETAFQQLVGRTHFLHISESILHH